jgi:hypothetical protein
MQTPPRRNCPKCNRSLACSGTATIDDQQLGVYQCDECLRLVRFFPESPPREVALTFAVDEAGTLFDPATGDEIPLDSLRGNSN